MIYLVGPEDFHSYAEVHANETRQLLEAFPVNQTSTTPILMGSFNHGNGTDGGTAPEYPDSHQAMLDAGYVSPYEQKVGLCTYCDDNVLTGNSSKRVVRDHIYVRQGTAVSMAKVFYNNEPDTIVHVLKSVNADVASL